METAEMHLLKSSVVVVKMSETSVSKMEKEWFQSLKLEEAKSLISGDGEDLIQVELVYLLVNH
jgi:hypothetical protein